MLGRLYGRQNKKIVLNSVMFGMYGTVFQLAAFFSVLPSCELAFGDGRGGGCSYRKNCLILSSLTSIKELKSQVLI